MDIAKDIGGTDREGLHQLLHIALVIQEREKTLCQSLLTSNQNNNNNNNNNSNLHSSEFILNLLRKAKNKK